MPEVLITMSQHENRGGGGAGGGGMDPIWKAMSKLRRGKLDECIEICNESLSRHPNDQVTVFYCMIPFFNYVICSVLL